MIATPHYAAARCGLSFSPSISRQRDHDAGDAFCHSPCVVATLDVLTMSMNLRAFTWSTFDCTVWRRLGGLGLRNPPLFAPRYRLLLVNASVNIAYFGEKEWRCTGHAGHIHP